MKIGVLTGGGDSPAINAALRAIVYQGRTYGYEIIAARNGWAGMINGDFFNLTVDMVEDVLTKSGTIIGSSRTNPFKLNKVDELKANIKKAGLDALISIGGDDTNGVMNKLCRLDDPINGVGIPQTIDNDIIGTEYAIGFDTAVHGATSAIDTIKTTAQSHNRVMVLEVMGRDAGHIALEAGVAGGANVTLVPEEDFDVEEISTFLKKRHDAGKNYGIVVVAEGAKPKGEGQITYNEKVDQFGHVMLGGIGKYLAEKIEEIAGLETRYTILGHLLRGGHPTAYDRFMSTRFGIEAVKLIKAGNFDKLVRVKDGKFGAVSLVEGLASTKSIDMDFYQEIKFQE